MKKRILSLILAMAMIVSGLMMPAQANAKENSTRFFLGAMGMPKPDRLIKGISNAMGNEKTGVTEYVATEQNFPTSFDLREHGLVTSVKNQNPYGTCWLFTMCASMESNAIMLGLADSNVDISEYQLGYFTYNIVEGQDEAIEGEGTQLNKWQDNGGWHYDAASTLMKGYGPVSEELCPYKNIKQPLSIEYATEYNMFDFNAVYTIAANDINGAKELITRNGAVWVTVCASSWDKNYYNEKTNAAYLPEWTDKYQYIDHAVTIVGWDDNYSKENFTTQPEKDGAWIVKNSWGKSWGDNGYFYLSYYDAALSSDYWIASATLSPLHSTDCTYQYDGGPGANWEPDISGVAMALTSKGNQTLTAISICPIAEYGYEFKSVKATINVYTDVTDEKAIGSGKCIYTQTVDVKYSEYQKIEFNKGVNLDWGKKYYITVNFSEPIWYRCDMSYERDGIVAPGKSGETFVTYGKGVWDDYSDMYEDYDGETGDVCIKAFVRNGHDMPVIHRLPTLDEPTFYLLNNEEAKVTVTWKTVEGAEGYNIYRKVKGVEADFSLLATVDAATTKYADTGLTIGQDYIYKVVPFAGSIEGNSAEKTIRATIAAPWLTKLENTKKGQIKVSIKAVKDAKSYSVYRLVGKTYQYIGNTTKTTFVDTFKKAEQGKYEKGVTYTYKLTVKVGNRTSALSAAKTITTNK